MKVTFDNIKDINYFPDKIGPNWDINCGREKLKSLLNDLNELNEILEINGEEYRKLFIDYQDYHNEYSPERIEPCPDYYGYFSLKFEKNSYQHVGDYMNLEDLDNALFILINFVEF